jgi:arsenite-transporting ATPase
LPFIESVVHKHANRYAVVPLLADQPVGTDKLMRLDGHGGCLDLQAMSLTVGV